MDQITYIKALVDACIDHSELSTEIRVLLLIRKYREAKTLEDKIKVATKIGNLRESLERIVFTQKIPRNRYFRRRAVDSIYYIDYVIDEGNRYRNADDGSYNDRRFKHRARMSKTDFDEFAQVVESEGWFPEYVATSDLRTHRRHPLRLMILSALSILGGSMTFGSLEDVTNVSETSHRAFLDKFVEVGSKQMFSKWITLPSSNEQLRELSKPYAMAGLPGAICSTDGVRIRMWSCSYALKNQNVGKEGYPTRSVQVSVNYSGKILSCSRTFDGNQPDVNIAKEDLLFQEFSNNPLYTDFEFTAYKRNYAVKDPNVPGAWTEEEAHGAWAIVDNGYPDRSFLQFPMKVCSDPQEESFSRMIESIRKDVERVFGILKQRFRVLKLGLTIQRFPVMEDVIHTCCAIHNFLVERSGRRICALPLGEKELISDRIYRRREVEFEPGSSSKRTRVAEQSHELRTLLIDNFAYLTKRNRVYWPRLVRSTEPNPYDDTIDPDEDDNEEEENANDD